MARSAESAAREKIRKAAYNASKRKSAMPSASPPAAASSGGS